MTIKRNAPGSQKEGGGSRAAKKRAKKKEKQLLVKTQASTTTAQEDDDDDTNLDPNTKSDDIVNNDTKNKKKLQLPFGDDDDDNEGGVRFTNEKRKKKKKTKKEASSKTEKKSKTKDETSTNEIKHDDKVIDEDEGMENEILEKFLSKLTPAQILFPEKYNSEMNGEEEDAVEDSGEPNPSDIVSHVTSEQRANALFSAFLSPSGLSRKSFYKHYWEKKPLLISRNKNLAEPDSSGAIYGDDLDLDDEDCLAYQHRFDGFLSKQDIEKLISEFPMKYGKDLNVTNYCNTGSGQKRRVTLDQLPNMPDNTEEEVEFIDVESNDVWSNFKSGCTIRLLCPQVRLFSVNFVYISQNYDLRF
jgi:hypothetical protein